MAKSDDLRSRILELSLHIGELQKLSSSDPDKIEEALSTTLKDLKASLEKLSVADEELCHQNEELTKSAEALKASEECARDQAAHLQALLYAAPTVIWIAHDKEGRSISGNRAAQELLRLPEGTNMSKMGPVPERLAHFRIFKDGIELSPQEMPVQRVASSGQELRDYAMDIVFDDGSVRSLLGNITPVHDSLGVPCGAVAAFMDITERKHAEEERERLAKQVSEEQRRLDAVLEQLPVAVQIADASGKLVFSNKQIEIIWRHPHLDSKNPAEYKAYIGFHLDGSPYKPGDYPLARTVATGEVVTDEEINILRGDGSRGTIMASSAPIRNSAGEIIASVEVFRDITELKEAEEALRRSRDELEQRVRERTAELSLAKEELEVTNEELLVELDHHHKLDAELIKAKEEMEVANEELHVELEQCRRLEVDLISANEELKVSNEELQVELEHHQMIDAELARAKGEAEAAAEAKAAFLADISHELRTPMNSVIGFTNLLLDERLTSEQRDYIESIRNCSESILALLNDIPEFSRAEGEKVVLEHQPFSLRHCIEESLDLVSIGADKKGLNLAYTVNYRTPDIILGDAGRIRQVLVNLLTNAVRFTDKGEVSISISSKAVQDNKHQILFEVKGTGVGIPQDKIDKLFQPFGQMEGAAGCNLDGTGLGLAISKNLVKLMGGEIWADSTTEGGTIFRFTIQAEALPGRPLDPGRTAKPNFENLADQRPLRILVAEDNPSNQRVLLEMLKKMGYHADAVADGKGVMDALEGQTYDIIFMDIRMAGMDGLKAAQEIRRRLPADRQPHIVAVTAYAMDGDRETCLESGMDDYIAKPIRNTEIEAIIKKYS